MSEKCLILTTRKWGVLSGRLLRVCVGCGRAGAKSVATRARSRQNQKISAGGGNQLAAARRRYAGGRAGGAPAGPACTRASFSQPGSLRPADRAGGRTRLAGQPVNLSQALP